MQKRNCHADTDIVDVHQNQSDTLSEELGGGG